MSTVAWYQVAATTGHTLTPETGTLSVSTSNPSTGGFTFVLDNLSSADSEIDLTDASGKSYVYVTSGDTNKVEVTPSDPTAEFSGLTWVVNYSGPSDTAAKIQVEWNELVSRYPTASVAATSDAGNTHVVRFGDTGSGASACVNGPYAMATNVALNGISWTSVEVTGASAPYAASVTITTSLVKTGFAAALTGTDGNEGTTPGGTHGITIATTLNAA